MNAWGTAGEVVSLEFTQPDGTGGVVRLLRWPEPAWFWTVLVSPRWGLIVVRDHDVAPPRRVGAPIRADGLWCELVETSPGEHLTVALEAFGVRLDDPLDAEHGERGERVAVGLDLEWESDGSRFGAVHGELLLGNARARFTGVGRAERGPLTPGPWNRAGWRLWWRDGDGAGGEATDADGHVDLDARGIPVAARVGAASFSVVALAVVPIDGRLVLAFVVGDAGCGWLEWWQPAPA